MRKGNVLKGLVLLISIFLLLPSSAFAQICQADLDFNGDVFPSDLMVFLAEYGRTDCDTNGPAPVPKTGQTTCYSWDGMVIDCTGTGQDGEYQKGVAWPNPRFTDNLDGTVTDNLTGLIWLKDANCFGAKNWSTAISDCNGLASGSCGLTDGSNAGDWRLANKREILSLVHDGYYNPALSNTAGTGQWSEADPFTGVQFNYYWSSTTLAYNTDYAWHVPMNHGYVYYNTKLGYNYVWPVRGGQ